MLKSAAPPGSSSRLVPPHDPRFRPRPGSARPRDPRIFENVTPVKKALYPRRTQLPPRLGLNTFLKKEAPAPPDPSETDLIFLKTRAYDDDDEEEEYGSGERPSWEPEEIEILSSLFERRISNPRIQKRAISSFSVPTYLPPPPPHRLLRAGLPKQKKREKLSSKNTYKSREFLLGLAREIAQLPGPEEVPGLLNRWAPFLRPGSLSLTIRELGHMGCPDRALKVFTWSKTQPRLYPDDQVMASTIEVLGSSGFPLKLSAPSSSPVLESVIKGTARGGDPDNALSLVKRAYEEGIPLSPPVYARLILELARTAGNERAVLALLNELGERPDPGLGQRECTAVMTVCWRIGRPDLAEGLFEWYRRAARYPVSVSMYATVMRCRYGDKRYREALALLWEMEGEGRILDLPLYRVVLRIYAALEDTAGVSRYFKQLKNAGFSPTFDVYRTVVKAYACSGRISKCRDVCREVEAAGFDLSKLLLEIEAVSPGVTAGIFVGF